MGHAIMSGDINGHKSRTSVRALNPLSSVCLLSGSPETETSQCSLERQLCVKYQRYIEYFSE